MSPSQQNSINSNNIQDPQMHFAQADKKIQEIVLSWFEQEHVKEYYYGEGLQNTLHNLDLYCQGINNNGRYSFDHWIACMGDEPFGFLMTSPLENASNPNNAKWYIEGKQTFTLDLLIGPTKFLGKGLAAKMIQKFILDQFSTADFFIIDPDASNTKAIHVYEQAGFKKVDEFYPSYDPKLHIMMRLAVKDLKDSTEKR